jgi:DNA repair photolyase
MTIIYEPRGKAREYSALAANLYKGCAHACGYCFAPSATFTDRETFSSDGYIRPRPGVLAQLAKDAEKSAGHPNPVLLSFTSDVYQPVERELGITRQALEILSANRLRPQILTKSGPWAIERDADILKSCNGIWAATLTLDNPEESLKWEPGAALPAERIEALRMAKEAGLETWVSLEPVLDPDAAIRLIQATHKFVDLYKVGKLNYHPHAKTIDWTEFYLRVNAQLDLFNCRRYLKNDLIEAFRPEGRDDLVEKYGIRWA